MSKKPTKENDSPESSKNNNDVQREKNISGELSSAKFASALQADEQSDLVLARSVRSGRNGPRTGTVSRRRFLGGMGAAAVVAAVGCKDRSPSGVDVDGGPDPDDDGGVDVDGGPDILQDGGQNVPAKVQGVEQTGATSTTINLSWQPARDAATYEVWINGAEAQTGIPETTVSVDGLEPETSYSVQVRARNEVGAGEFSDPITAQTAEQSSGNLPPIPADQNPPPPPVPTGTIYWVATDGSDNNSGAEESPFATVEKAYNVASASDGIYLKAGTHIVEGRINWTKTDIIMRGGPGTTREGVIVEGLGSRWAPIIWIQGDDFKENLQFYGLTFQGGPAPSNPEWLENRPDSERNTWKESNWKLECIWVGGYSHNIKFINCVFRHYFYRGIFSSGGSDLFPNNVEVAYNNFYAGGWHTAGGDVNLGTSAGYYHVHHNEMHGGVDGFVTHGARYGQLCEYNHIYDQYREDGIDIKHSPNSNPLLPSGSRTVLRNNIIHNCHMQGVTVQRGARHVDVYDNVLYDNGHGTYVSWSGVINPVIWINGLNQNSDSSDPGPTQDVRIWNNRVFDNNGSGIRVTHHRGDYPRDIQIENNYIYDNIGYGISFEAGQNITCTGNILSNNEGRDETKAQYNSNRMSHLTSDNNTVYLPDSSYHWGRSGGTNYTLAQWQSTFNKDLNSTVITGTYVPPED